MSLRGRHKILLGFIGLLLLLFLVFYLIVSVSPPDVDTDITNYSLEKIDETNLKLGPNTLKKNDSGVWEMYVEGDAYQRGIAIGKLSEELMYYQESNFVKEVVTMLPSHAMMHLLKLVVAWENREIQTYIPDEFEREIYGVSKYLSDDFNKIGPKFHRKLFYHSAHDIGHTVQNMGLVGCSAFSAWGKHTVDGDIITGRNFDFYIGEAFKKNKVLLFMKPKKGHAFASYSWPGMIGVLSGMNEKGLTVSLNAGPPATPRNAKMPVSLLAREILQYSGTIADAVAIAKKRKTFVSESFVVSSAADRRSIIIEKSPDTTMVVEATDDLLFCTNHFQSEVFKYMESNVTFRSESSTLRRMDRMKKLLATEDSINVSTSVTVLRDMGDQENNQIGIGNEENLNIMLTHHSIIFEPQKSTIWISIGDSPMDAFLKYDLKEVFAGDDSSETAAGSSQKIPASSWLNSDASIAYQNYFENYTEIEEGIENNEDYTSDRFDKMISYNPNLYKGYFLAGSYFSQEGDCPLALKYLESASAKVIPWAREREEINKLIKACE